MALVPWRRANPQTTASTFSSMPELGRFFDEFFSGMPLVLGPTSGTWAPAIAFSETPQAYVLKAELPGLNPDQVDIQVSDDAVVIKGERKEEKKAENEHYLLHPVPPCGWTDLGTPARVASVIDDTPTHGVERTRGPLVLATRCSAPSTARVTVRV